MNRRYKELFKNASIFTIGSFSSKVRIFLLVPFYTNYLSTEEYGYYDLSYVTIQLLFPIFTLGISEGIVRFLLEGKDKKTTISLAARHLIISTFIVSAILFINRVFRISDFLIQYMWDFWAFFFAFSVHSFLISIAKGNEQIKEIAVAGVLGTATMIAFNVLFLMVYPLQLHGFFMANYASSLISSCYLAVKTRIWSQLSLERNREREKTIILYSLPLVLNSLGWWANNTSDRYIVSFLCGVSVNGLISIAYKISNIISVFGSFFLQAWQISAVKEYEENRNSKIYKNLFLYMNAGLCAVSGLFILFSKVLGTVFFSKDFSEAWVFVPLLIISALLNQAAGFVGPILGAKYKSNAIGRAAFAGIIVNVILNIILTLLIGPQGITIATVIASFIIFALRERETDSIIRGPFYRRIILSWFVLCIEAAAVSFFGSFLIAGVCTLLVFAIYLDTYRQLSRMILTRVKG